ncbi:MAG: hypothetical protein JNM18_08665, partial [Planctomycetaceae bacterium]|nr:hypothetical protein [Planctomycetaceae bacterium]
MVNDDALAKIRSLLSQFDLENGLIFLNRLSHIARGETSDSQMAAWVQRYDLVIFPHILHYLGKELLNNASYLNIRKMSIDDYHTLHELVVSSPDPILDDPDWIKKDPSGLFERLLQQQIIPQHPNLKKKIGLALGLFRDLPAVNWPITFDLRSEIENEIECPVESFIKQGFIASALSRNTCDGVLCRGAFDERIVREAFHSGFADCEPVSWLRFLERISCDRDTFRTRCKPTTDMTTITPEPRIGDCEALATAPGPFAFNPLWQFPVIKGPRGDYIAIDPALIIERVTLGLFCDMHNHFKGEFTSKFGYTFEAFVGHMLREACSSNAIWSASDWEASNGANRLLKQKISDWVIRCNNANVLVECKSMRASLELRQTGSDASIHSVNNRIADAVTQLSVHAASIMGGDWESEGIARLDCVGIIVTYGKLFSPNAPFSRDRIKEMLSARGIQMIPYVTLSLEDFDSVIHLVETGHSLSSLVATLSSANNVFAPLRPFRAELAVCE